jgi:hypothetical protein
MNAILAAALPMILLIAPIVIFLHADRAFLNLNNKPGKILVNFAILKNQKN